jgi:periplasmic divalent cation tolerance protein
MTEAVAIALTTLPSREEADRSPPTRSRPALPPARRLDGPTRSHYVWEGKVENEEEYRVTFKFAVNKGADLEAWVHSRHPYAVPQWLAFAADARLTRRPGLGARRPPTSWT